MPRIQQSDHTQIIGTTTRDINTPSPRTDTTPKPLRHGLDSATSNDAEGSYTRATPLHKRRTKSVLTQDPATPHVNQHCSISGKKPNWDLFILVTSKLVILRGRIGNNLTDCNFKPKIGKSGIQPHSPNKITQQIQQNCISGNDQVICTLSTCPQKACPRNTMPA